MVLASMRKGVMSFIFMSLLVIGGLGLVMTDAGGFFRNGVSRTDIANVDGQRISAIQFDREVRRMLQGQQMTAQDAYKSGLINQYLNNQLTKILVAKEAKALGIVLNDATVARQVKSFIEQSPIPVSDPKEAFKVLLQQRGMSEQEFVAQLRNEVSAQLLMRAVSGTTLLGDELQPPALLIQALADYAATKRDVDMLEFKYADMAEPKAPDDKTLAAFYEETKDEYAIEETRDITVAVFSSKLFPELNDDQIYELTNKIDDRIEAGETVQSLKDEYRFFLINVKDLKATDKPESLTALDKQVERLVSIAFETNNGETSHLTELPNGNMAAITVDKVHEASYEPFEKVKDKVLAEWKKTTRENELVAKVNAIVNAVNKDKKSLHDASKAVVTRQEGVSRSTNTAALTMLDAQKVMDAPLGEAQMLRGDKGIMVVVGVADHATKASAEDVESLAKSYKTDVANDIQDEYLAALQKKYKVHINQALLDQMYGSTSEEEAQ